MRTKVGIFAVLAAVGALVLAGCGNDSPPPSTGGTSTTTETLTVVVPPTTAEELAAFVEAGTPVNVQDYAYQGGAAFQSPAGAVSCGSYDAYSFITCRTQDATWPENPRPATCEQDWSPDTVTANVTGVTRGRCAGDPPFPMPGEAKVLPAGSSLIVGQVGCRVDNLGVGCLNLNSGYGFFISPQTYQTFGPYAS